MQERRTSDDETDKSSSHVEPPNCLGKSKSKVHAIKAYFTFTC